MKTFAIAMLLASSSAFATTWAPGTPIGNDLMLPVGSDTSLPNVGGEVLRGSEISSDSYVFELDARYVDGALDRVTIEKNADGTYSANHLRVTPGFGAPVESTLVELGQGLKCLELRPDDSFWGVTCSVDNRPADGLLVEVIVRKDQNGRFDVSLREAAYSMIPGVESYDETTVIASDLKLLK